MKEFDSLYFVGAGGIGMAALERYFLALGKRIAPQREVVLEVKYGEYYPMYLKQVLQNNGIKLAVSKFVLGCDYLKNNYIVL